MRLGRRGRASVPVANLEMDFEPCRNPSSIGSPSKVLHSLAPAREVVAAALPSRSPEERGVVAETPLLRTFRERVRNYDWKSMQ